MSAQLRLRVVMCLLSIYFATTAGSWMSFLLEINIGESNCGTFAKIRSTLACDVAGGLGKFD